MGLDMDTDTDMDMDTARKVKSNNQMISVQLHKSYSLVLQSFCYSGPQQSSNCSLSQLRSLWLWEAPPPTRQFPMPLLNSHLEILCWAPQPIQWVWPSSHSGEIIWDNYHNEDINFKKTQIYILCFQHRRHCGAWRGNHSKGWNHKRRILQLLLREDHLHRGHRAAWLASFRFLEMSTVF